MSTFIKQNFLYIGIAVLALAGLADSAFLAVSHYAGLPLPCTVFSGCEAVATSPYSKVLGIPLSLLGVFFYAGIFLLSLLSMFWKGSRAVVWLLLLGIAIGFVSSAIFVYIQAALIQAFCIYCIFSALISLCLVFFGIPVFVGLRKGSI